jgi:carboxypeptidase Q
MAAGKTKLKALLGLILMAGCVSTDMDRKKESREAVFNAINGEVMKNSRAYGDLEKAINTIGHRLTGSENGRRTEEHVYDLLKGYGYDDVEFHEFEAVAWTRGNVGLRIEYPADNRNAPGIVQAVMPQCVSLAHSPVKANVSGSLIDVGNGLRSDFESRKQDVAGKIVLVNIGIYPADSTLKNLHRSEKTALAIQYGAAGAIFVNTVEGDILLTGTASVTGELIPIPAVCISLEDAKKLRDSIFAPGQLRDAKAFIQMTNRSEKVKARNIIATIKGSELPDEEIIIGGHLDSWDLSTGAIDNGIGSFAIIDMARTFKKLNLQPRRTVRFILFMGEEQGLLGSKAYVRDRIADKSIDKVRYMINLDMDGNPKGFNACGRSEMEAFIREAGDEIAKVDTTFKNKFANSVGLHSDHQTFMLEGIPVLGIESNLDPSVYRFYHSNKDNFNLVNKEHLANSVRFTAMMLYALADAESIAAKRLTSQETKVFFEKANLREELVLGKEWKW